MDLGSPVNTIPLVGKSYQTKLEKLNIFTVKDLLFHIPSRYEDYRKIEKISNLMFGDTVSVQGEVIQLKNNYTRYKKNYQSAIISDDSGNIQIIWFNQAYILKNIKVGDKLSISGKVGDFSNHLSFISPDYEVIRGNKTLHTAKIIPTYPETAGVSSKWLRSRINHVLNKLNISEYIPNNFMVKYELIELQHALDHIHRPKNLLVIENAKKRLAFEELLEMQIRTAKHKKDWKNNSSTHTLSIDEILKKDFKKLLPFKLTRSQERSIKEILIDLSQDHPMNRLLEGDVGSGKTIVAAAAIFAAYRNGFQSILMAPTQILAEQHFRSLQKLFEAIGIQVELIVSGSKNINKNADLIVGTHALIHDKVDLNKVAVVIIDEQHRFGVEQRKHLIIKSKAGNMAPHSLTMTATPIPRTVALTFYGELDLSTLDELPKGRKSITTWVVPEKKREGAYHWIKEQIENDKVQVFVVCPLIEESDHESMQQVKAVTVEYEKLTKIFNEQDVGLLHGKQKNVEKNDILNKFKNNDIDILVSTPVVEVGIDIPNATIMMIEGADRFGLAQLHQLRGRVGRGKKKSYCLLFTESKSRKSIRRLNALTQMHSGFELAELDLEIRGPGEILGIKQHGFLQLKAASWQDRELIKATKQTANELVSDPDKYSDFFEKKYGNYEVLN